MEPLPLDAIRSLARSLSLADLVSLLDSNELVNRALSNEEKRDLIEANRDSIQHVLEDLSYDKKVKIELANGAVIKIIEFFPKHAQEQMFKIIQKGHNVQGSLLDGLEADKASVKYKVVVDIETVSKFLETIPLLDARIA